MQEPDEKQLDPVLFENADISWIYTPGSGVVDPPVQTRIQELPFEKLDWRDFEKLCLRLIRLESQLDRCRLYGAQGDDQQGIDIYARKVGSEKYTVYQCKNEQDFGASKIRDAVDLFITEAWAVKSDSFVLCARESLKNAQRTDEVEKQTGILRTKNIAFIVWDKDELSLKLKSQPEIVDDFFGREWVKSFCGDEASARLVNRLDVQRVQLLRSQLLPLYSSTFNTHDRGIPLPDALPLLKRFIVPDIENTQTLTLSKGGSANNSIDTSSSEISTASDKDLNSLNSPLGQRTYEYISRIPLQNWLIKEKRSLIIGEPGSGKSSLLRYIAIDLLSEKPTLALLAEKWGGFLPVFIPFAAWTKMISTSGISSQSVKEMALEWLRSIDAHKQIPLIEEALEDKRLLLLIDGLDERANEDSARIAINKIESFISNHDVAVIATARPHGLEQLSMNTHDWRRGFIADLSKRQRNDLATLWFTADLINKDSKKSAQSLAKDVEQLVESFFVEIKKSPQLQSLLKNPMQLCLLILFRIKNIRISVCFQIAKFR